MANAKRRCSLSDHLRFIDRRAANVISLHAFRSPFCFTPGNGCGYATSKRRVTHTFFIRCNKSNSNEARKMVGK
ncbi:hypothetical protein KPH14_003152 [Odynerus spinipes]|uniref:Uncharacterized protein n=1 Tax=Odynerus spinipes TaxID=1348599 RepID=A0AAD9RX92_9HYME|nr:hypothetical protein KPH14_003152 [Odynerus spinipes]